jgi:dihydrofolate reductase
MNSKLSLIAVIGKNRELGRDNDLLWHIPGDLPRFKKITLGHPVIMGRKTFESIGKPLAGRTNIVVTRDTSYKREGITVVFSLDEAIVKAKVSEGNEEVFVIGGGSIFAQAIERADRLYLTVVAKQEKDADTFFPDYSRFGKVLTREPQEVGGFSFVYLTLE